MTYDQLTARIRQRVALTYPGNDLEIALLANIDAIIDQELAAAVDDNIRHIVRTAISKEDGWIDLLRRATTVR